MSNAALAWVNLFDSATVTASSAAASTPATSLQVEQVSTKWRGTGGTTDSITATWASDQTADTFMINGLGSLFLATGTVKLQLTSNGGVTGDVYDSGTEAGKVDPNYGYAIHLLTSKTFRSAKWTFVQAGASYIEAGRAFVGVRTVLEYNFEPGFSYGRIDMTRVTTGKNGQDFIDRSNAPKARTVDFSLGWVPETQRWSVHEAIQLANGIHTDLLFIINPASTNLGRDSIWGRVTELSPVTQPFNIADLYSTSYRIKERL